MWVIWPSFLCACVLEMIIFAFINPTELAIAHEPINWSARAIYSVSFFVLWAGTFASSAITVWLAVLKK
jgi:hypothetical protein